MAKEAAYSNKGYEENRKIAKAVKKKPIWVRWKCQHHYLYCGMVQAGIRKLYICEKCGHVDVW